MNQMPPGKTEGSASPVTIFVFLMYMRYPYSVNTIHIKINSIFIVPMSNDTVKNSQSHSMQFTCSFSCILTVTLLHSEIYCFFIYSLFVVCDVHIMLIEEKNRHS